MIYTESNLRIFLEQAGAGCISGRVSEWPQLKPACRWAIKEIERLERAVSAPAAAAPSVPECPVGFTLVPNDEYEALRQIQFYVVHFLTELDAAEKRAATNPIAKRV